MAFFRQFPKTGYDFESNGVITKIIDIFRTVRTDSVFLDDMSTYQYFQVRNGERPDVVSNILYGTPEYYWTFFVINEHLKTGLSGWPMGTAEFEDYIRLEYSGTVIDTEPVVVKTPDGTVARYDNSLAGRFTIGETITGATSLATGILKEKNVPMSQLILGSVSGNFKGSFNPETGERETEVITGATSGSNVVTSLAYKHRDAPHHYEDPNGLEMYNSRFINERLTIAGIQSNAAGFSLTPVSYYEYELQLNEERGNIRIVRPNVIYQFAQVFGKLINE